MKRATRILPLAVLLALASHACSDDKTFVVVKVSTTDGEIAASQFRVYVSIGADRKDDGLYYPRTPASTPYHISPTETVDFSVDFSSSYLGAVTIGVEPRNSDGVALGYGEAKDQVIDPGHVMHADVAVTLAASPPSSSSTDASVPDAQLPPSQCEPTAPATCGANKTCIVDCYGGAGVGACVTSGAHAAGETCAGNNECSPGTQCFKYACGQACVKFCSNDADCGDGKCFASVPCGSTPTTYKICSQPCDPRGAATLGCATGLNCLLFPGQESACDCTNSRRVGQDGATCTDAGDCAPGLICVTGAIGHTCRPICKLSDKDCPAGRTCSQLLDPTYQIWGACLPTP